MTKVHKNLVKLTVTLYLKLMFDRSPSKATRTFYVGMWLALCTGMVAFMILLGGATRLTDSGLSIVDWRPLTGIFPPLNEADWIVLYEKYKSTAEFQRQNFWMGPDDFKSIFWLEFLHRVMGRIIGVAFVFPFLWFLISGKLAGGLLPKCSLILALGCVQGYMGWYMVQSGLTERTDVSQYRLAAHLGLAIIIFIALLWLSLTTLQPGKKRKHQLSKITKAFIFIVFTTTIAGAFVAGIDAGLAYNTFPLMDDRYLPVGWLQMEPVWRNFFENTATVQFIHRQLGIFAVIFAILLWVRAWQKNLTGRAKCAANLVAIMAFIQMGLGITTLLTKVPLIFGLMHQAGALCVISLSVWMLYELTTERYKYSKLAKL
ncbi:MAG: COX15/CtaA family protein [Pseudomonadota bacterium]|nr:COX15/CtaA family protein [Pseudomonadota bacterium]